MKKRFSILGIVLLMLVASCYKAPVDEFVAVADVALNHTAYNLEERETLQLQATVSPENASVKQVKWESSHHKVAIVSESGFVTAVGEGTTVVTASVGGKSAKCQITVRKAAVAVGRVTLDKKSIELEKGLSEILEATIEPDNATDKTIHWSTSDQNVANVDRDGKVTAVGGGTATITATAGDCEAQCVVNVTVPVASIALNIGTLTLEPGQRASLEAVVLPDDASDKNVVWSSDAIQVATVGRDGTVTAIGEGNCQITATSGGCSAYCNISVSKAIIKVESISLDKTTLSLAIGSGETITATVLPVDATDRRVYWASTNSAIADVDDYGYVTARSTGSVTITATTSDQGLVAACEVTAYVPYVPVTGINLNKSSIELLQGQSQKLIATVRPADAAEKAVIWTTSDAAVASVSNEGVITAMSEGTATITATAGEMAAECIVTVTIPEVPVIQVERVILDCQELTLDPGQSATISATVYPDDATDKTIVWTSDNEQVATVSQAGRVEAIAEGTARVTASSGNRRATCTVTVNKPVISVTGVALNQTQLSMEVRGYAQLLATVSPSDATDKTVVWTSDNVQVATVSQAGRVEAVAEGTARVTATSGDCSATCTVTVNRPIVSVTGVALSQTQLSLEVEGYAQLNATVSPPDATDKTVLWSSSNVAVAEVDDFGTVVARAPGQATITVTTNDGNITATCLVTVSEPEVPPVDPPQPPEPEEHPYTSNVSWTLGSRAYDHTTGGEYPGQTAVINSVSVNEMVKLGTGSGGGDFTINIPAGTTYIGFFALGWKGSAPKLTITCAGKQTTIDIKPNNGVAQTPPYTISTTEEEAYHTYVIPSSTATTVKMASEGRVVIWGINYYTGEAPGGDTPGGDTPGGGDPPGGDDDPVFAGWMELPAIDNPNLKFVIHESTVNPSGRNYSLYWDSSALVAHWVAYPMNADIIGTGSRTDQWGYDPKLDPSEQPLLKKAYTGSWDRGHQIASADRLKRADNIQTFYYTNMTPQNGSFNGGIWNNLENKVRAWSKQLDTLYVVSGCVVEGSTTYAKDNNGRNVTVPVAYYKALLGFDKSKSVGIASQTSGYTGIAFYFDHHGNYSSSSFMNYSMTIDALEAKVGIDFFVNLPPAIGEDKANKVESTRDNWWSK